MTDTPAYTPPEVWVWEKDDSPKWRYGNINRSIAGATHEKELARGKHPLQLERRLSSFYLACHPLRSDLFGRLTFVIFLN